MHLLKRQPGVVLNRAELPEAAPDAAPAPGTARDRPGPQASLGLCVLAPLCLASMAVLWEGLYAHRDRNTVPVEGEDWPS